MTPWQRISETMYRLDDVWTVREDEDGWWRAYRAYDRLLGRFANVNDAMLEAERLRKEDEGYR